MAKGRADCEQIGAARGCSNNVNTCFAAHASFLMSMRGTRKADVSMSNSSCTRLARLAAAASKEFFWGCKLTKEEDTVTWSFEEEDDDMDYLEHTLFLRHAILGSSAKSDERHIVQIETTNFEGEDVVQPIVSMTVGKDDKCQLNMTFSHLVPVKLKLIEGSGPLYLSGQHVVEFPEEVEDDPLTVTETEADLESDIQDVEEVETVKAMKRKANGVTKGSKKKRGKYESASSENEDDDDENGDSADLGKNGNDSAEDEDEEESMDATEEDEEEDEPSDESSDEDYTGKSKSKKRARLLRGSPQ